VRSDIPALILSGEYDPVSPPAWAERVASSLENDHLFSYPGMGHGVTTVFGCSQEMMLAFLDDPTVAPDDTCITELRPLRFAGAAGAETIELKTYRKEEMGIGGVVPVGWTESVAGVFSRASSVLDAAAVLAQAAPVSAEELLIQLVDKLELDAVPRAVGQRQGDGFTWTLYAVSAEGLEIDMALAESSGLALLVMLQSEPGERDALYDAAFLPMVDALAPLARPAVEVADAFMTAVKEADYAEAYELCDPELQAEFGSAEGLGTWMEERGIKPLIWHFLSRAERDDEIDLAGTGTFPADQVLAVKMVLVQVEGEWRVAGFSVG
jgi:hypothetical protein